VFTINYKDKSVFGMEYESVGTRHVAITDGKNHTVWIDNWHLLGTSLGAFPLTDNRKVSLGRTRRNEGKLESLSL